MSSLSQLPLTRVDGLTLIGGSALIVYFVFKRVEPAVVSVWTGLLGLLPASLSYVYHLMVVPRATMLQSVAVTFALFYFTLLLAILFYRLSPFHPLSGYPGPRVCKASKIRFALKARTGHQHLYLQCLHDTYGDIVRIGPNEISIRDAAAIHPLMGTTGVPKGQNWDGRVLHNPVRSMIAIRDSAEHVQRRRPWSRAFSSSKMKEYEPIIARRTSEFVDAILEKKGTFDFAKMISYFTFDFMSDMAFGGGSDMMKNEDKEGLWKILDSGLERTIILDHLPWLAHLVKLIPGAAKDVKLYRALGVKKASERQQSGSKINDLFYYLSNDDKCEKVTPPHAVTVADGILAMVAGADTSSTALSNLIYCILRHPPTYQRLQEEIDEFYPAGESTFDTKYLKEMHYLDAVINETLRLYPPVPSGSQRTTTEETGGKLIGDHYIPIHTQVRVHTWSLHRDSRNFSPVPESFWPERWLVAEQIMPAPLGSSPFTHNMNAFIPFSYGPANCVGKNLAILEMKMLKHGPHHRLCPTVMWIAIGC
ncbi:Cytochrome P450 superfamily protein [Abortiporus biennis]